MNIVYNVIHIIYIIHIIINKYQSFAESHSKHLDANPYSRGIWIWESQFLLQGTLLASSSQTSVNLVEHIDMIRLYVHNPSPTSSSLAIYFIIYLSNK